MCLELKVTISPELEANRNILTSALTRDALPTHTFFWVFIEVFVSPEQANIIKSTFLLFFFFLNVCEPIYGKQIEV